jgi:hypothetical protein
MIRRSLQSDGFSYATWRRTNFRTQVTSHDRSPRKRIGGRRGVVLLQYTLRKDTEKVDYENAAKDHVSHKEPKHVCTSALDQGIMQSSVA